MKVLLALLYLVLASAAQGAEPAAIRLAILVGNDLGRPVRPALRFAASDARKMRDVLVRVGGFASDNVMLLEDRTAADLDAALDKAARRVAAAGGPALLLFYFSGHADGVALELGEDGVPFAHVRKRLEESGATLRIALVDACLSGQMIGLRGASLAPAFDIDVTGDLAAEGTVVLTSTAADEMAQESVELGGAVFTHHLVSGLYGAADEDRDRQVSLGELYRYTYGRTLGATARSLAGPQHPAYGFALEGKGDVVLASMPGGAGMLSFPAALHGSFFVLAGDDVLAQVDQAGDADRTLALPAGRYTLVRRHAQKLEQALITLSDTGLWTLAPGDFSPTALTLAEQRGGDGRALNRVVVFYALSGWFMPEMGALHAGGMLLRRQVSIVELQLRAGYGSANVNDREFRYELRVLDLAVAALLRIPIYRLDLLVGPLLGVARLAQESAFSGHWSTWSAAPGFELAADIQVWRDLSLYLSWELDVMLFHRDGALRAQPAPRAALGIGYAF